MSDFDIKCRKCGNDIVHHCVFEEEFDEHPDEPLISLFSFNVAPPDLEAFKKSGYYNADRKDECLPFFSEAYLYNLLGKEDGRTVLYSMRQALRHLGVDVRALERLADGIIPCPHCSGSGRIRRRNPDWDREVYAKKKKEHDDGTLTQAELQPYKRYFLDPCQHCEAGKAFGKRIEVKSTC
jgi:hypothetical protein